MDDLWLYHRSPTLGLTFPYLKITLISRKADGKFRTLAHSALHRDFSAMQRNNLLCDRKSQAAALGLFFCICPPVIPGKQFCLLFLADAFAIIPDRNTYAVSRIFPDRYCYFRVRRVMHKGIDQLFRVFCVFQDQRTIFPNRLRFARGPVRKQLRISLDRRKTAFSDHG